MTTSPMATRSSAVASVIVSELPKETQFLETDDILGGILAALLLVLIFKSLQSTTRSSTSTSSVVWGSSKDSDKIMKNDNISMENEEGSNKKDFSKSEKVVFGADDWRDVMRQESYVLKLPERKSSSFETQQSDSRSTNETTQSSEGTVEKKWVLLGLLLVFVPLFSLELFLALSRGFLCGMMPQDYDGDVVDLGQGSMLNLSQQYSWARYLCSPVQ